MIDKLSHQLDFFLSILSTFLHPQTNGSCPLHLASAGGHTEVVKVLLEAGASVAEEDAVSDGENTTSPGGD